MALLFLPPPFAAPLPPFHRQLCTHSTHSTHSTHTLAPSRISRIVRLAIRLLRRRPPQDNHTTTNNNNNDATTPPHPPNQPLATLSALPTPLSAAHALSPPVRIMLLISDTGGGHRASAEALVAAFSELYPSQTECLVVDFWTQIVGRPFLNFPEGYSFLAKNPPLWRAAWNYGKFPITRRLTEEFSNVVGNGNFRRALHRFDPHLIVSVHPLTQFIPLRVLRTMDNAPPFVTVCTDLGGAHPTWFHRAVDLCFVPSNRVRGIATKCGLTDAQLRQFGLPVRPDFWQDARGKPMVRAGLRVGQLPTVLIVGGGDGVGGVGRIARAVAERVSGVQLVVVCGKNGRLRRELESVDWPIDVVVKGFVDNMSEWMAASDIIVSKAGPGTIAEALIRGLPIILSGFLPGQEAPNVRYVVEGGVGEFSRDPVRIAEIVDEWMADEDGLKRRAMRAREMGRPMATYQIVREIAKLTTLEPAAGDLV